MSTDRYRMHANSKFKIGLFGANCSSGRALTTVPDRWLADWDSCLTMARQAEDAGFDFILPIGRWKGYGGQTDFQGSNFETITWATGLLASTQRITVFGTIHAPLFNPMVAAKQMVTADQVGHGRFALNIVVGWNEAEFHMSGIRQRDHGDRYDYADEWISVIKRMWSEREAFDFNGEFLEMRGVVAEPKPFGGTSPLIINAGQSSEGKAFAQKHCNGFFTDFSALGVDGAAAFVENFKAETRKGGREIDVYTQGHVVCRPTKREAEEYFHYSTVEAADLEGVDQLLKLRNITPENTPDYEDRRKRFPQKSIGLAIVGTPDDVAGKLAQIHAAGISGIGFSLTNYVKETPFLAEELMPRLQRLGLRDPVQGDLAA